MKQIGSKILKVLLFIAVYACIIFTIALYRDNNRLREENREYFKKILKLELPHRAHLEKPWYFRCVKDGKIVTDEQPEHEFSLTFGNYKEGANVVDHCIISRKKLD